MNSLINLSSRGQRPPWPRRKPPSRSLLLFPSLLLITLLFFLCYYYSFVSKSSLPVSRSSLPPAAALRCNPEILGSGERFLWYAPHSGFSNQLSELRNAALIAGILNRTLVVPPVLDHHAVALGSCPKFRVLGPEEIRAAVWGHSLELMRSGRYISMADIVDMSSVVSSSLIRVIDFRVFASLFCGVSADSACSGSSITQPGLLEQCGSFLSGANGNVDKCLYAVDEDCRSTVWIYQKDDEDGKLDLFQPDEQLKKKKKISYVRRRHDVYKFLGPGTNADSAVVLAFGSLFTSPYKGSQLLIDITKAPTDEKIQSLIEKMELLPFVPEIVNAGKEFVEKTINAPFLCAQLRLLDGQFKNHWKSTFLGLKQMIESLRQKGPHPIHIFVMTDLPRSNWTGNYLGELAQDSSSYKLHFLQAEDELVARTSDAVSAAGHSLRIGTIPHGFDRVEKLKKKCSPKESLDVLLYIEEVVCSCASLGFVGTAGSTIAESIELMRKYDSCSLNTPTTS